MTAQTTSGVGTMTASYGPGGQMLSQQLPSDVGQLVTLDRAGNEVAVTYVLDDGPLVAWSTGVDVLGRTVAVTAASPSGGLRQTALYDPAGRRGTSTTTGGATSLAQRFYGDSSDNPAWKQNGKYVSGVKKFSVHYGKNASQRGKHRPWE